MSFRDDFDFLTIHGFNDRSKGEDNVDKTEPYFKRLGYGAFEKDEADYGYYKLLQVWFNKHSAILRIARGINNLNAKYAVILAYSNGAHYLIRALPYVFRDNIIVILCSPALDRKHRIPANIKNGWVFHIRSDWVVWLASFIPFSHWGRMGAVGYKGKDPRIVNVDYTDIAKFHGGMWEDGAIEFFVHHVDRILAILHQEDSQ